MTFEEAADELDQMVATWMGEDGTWTEAFLDEMALWANTHWPGLRDYALHGVDSAAKDEAFASGIIADLSEAENTEQKAERLARWMYSIIWIALIHTEGLACFLEADAKALEQIGYTDGIQEVLRRIRKNKDGYDGYLAERLMHLPDFTEQLSGSEEVVGSMKDYDPGETGYIAIPLLLQEPAWAVYISMVMNAITESDIQPIASVLVQGPQQNDFLWEFAAQETRNILDSYLLPYSYLPVKLGYATCYESYAAKY